MSQSVREFGGAPAPISAQQRCTRCTPSQGGRTTAAAVVAGQPAFSSQDFPTLGSHQASGSSQAAQASTSHKDSGAGGDVGSFGMAGLLAMPTTVTTTDLTTLGLNLTSRSPLHPSFGLPWSDDPQVQDLEAPIPSCFAVSAPPLRTGHFKKFGDATLMYIFYCMPRDTLQLYAAHELYARGWHYHVEARMWFTPTADAPQGQYDYFNLSAWDKQKFSSDNAANLPRGFLPVADLGPLPSVAPAAEGDASQGGSGGGGSK